MPGVQRGDWGNDGYSPLVAFQEPSDGDRPAELLAVLLAEPEGVLLEMLAHLQTSCPGLLQRALANVHAGRKSRLTIRSPRGVPWQIGNAAKEEDQFSSPELATEMPQDDCSVPNAMEPEVLKTHEDIIPQRTRKESSCPDVPIIQFSAFTYFCQEDEGTMQLDVMRIGDCLKASEVTFTTRDSSAKQGKHYTNVTCRIVFEKGESQCMVEVPLLESSDWDTTLEFAVELIPGEGGLVNAALGRYLYSARVKVIDNDKFPTNKYASEIHGDAIHEAPKLGLFIEYLKFNWSDPVVRGRSIKFACIDQLHNLYDFFHLFLNVYLVDYVLNPEFNDDGLVLGLSRQLSLLIIAIAELLPFAALHFLAYIKAEKCGVGGTSRLRLQSALIRKFLNYEAGVRLKLRNGDLIMGMTRDSTALVGDGYKGILSVVKELGQLILMLVYQFMAPVVFGRPFSRLGFAPLIAFPLLMGLFLMKRDEITSVLLSARNKSQTGLVNAVEETVGNYRLVADYGQREKSVRRFEHAVKDFNTTNRNTGLVLLNSAYYSKWLSVIAIVGYTLGGGMNVLSGYMTLGMFLNNISIFAKIGSAWGQIYKIFLDISTIFPAMQNIFISMNLPTDVAHRKKVNRKIRRETAALRAQLHEEDKLNPNQAVPCDRMRIKLGNLTFTYHTSSPSGDKHTTVLNQKGLLDIQQGWLTCLVGPRGGGKTTLLKLIGGEILPNPDDIGSGAAPRASPGREGQFHMPSHLRTLHVSGPLFFEGTILDNLLFGVAAGDDDGRRERVVEICTKLGLKEEVVRHTASNDKHVWSDVFSATQCQLLSIATALIANPEVLCIHKPTQYFDSETAQKVASVFREFVDTKGLECPGPRRARRPRTCIMTTADTANLRYAHAVFNITAKSGIRLVKWADKAQ